MNKLVLCCWALVAFGANNLNAAERKTPQINECLDPTHPSGLNLERIKERAQDINPDIDDPAIQVMFYINLKNKISEILRSSSKILSEAQQNRIRDLISCSNKLKNEICASFGISDAQLMLIKEIKIPSLDDAPSIDDCKDPNSACGLNLAKVAEREQILRLNGIANDASTYVILFRRTKRSLLTETNQENTKRLVNSLKDNRDKILKSEFNINSEQILAIQ